MTPKCEVTVVVADMSHALKASCNSHPIAVVWRLFNLDATGAALEDIETSEYHDADQDSIS
jgi:hypothetical protein